MQFFSYLINGISLGSVYALIALGYTMVYGIAKMLNFAHGDVIMVGAYISFCVTNYLGLPVVVSILAAMAVCTLLGVLIEGLAYKPLRGTPSLAVLITAIGVSYFLQNAAQLIWSSSPKNFTSIVTFQPLRLAGGQLVVTGEVGDELGDASVPFNFDVHALIFTDDAPGLEASLHQAFADRKLNMINTRREFFHVTLDEIKEVVRQNYDKTVEFVDVPPAEQYRESLKMVIQCKPPEETILYKE